LTKKNESTGKILRPPSPEGRNRLITKNGEKSGSIRGIDFRRHGSRGEKSSIGTFKPRGGSTSGCCDTEDASELELEMQGQGKPRTWKGGRRRRKNKRTEGWHEGIQTAFISVKSFLPYQSRWRKIPIMVKGPRVESEKSNHPQKGRKSGKRGGKATCAVRDFVEKRPKTRLF